MTHRNRSKKTVVILISVIFAALFVVFDCTHFLYDTSFGDVDCSGLSLRAATKKIENETTREGIDFFFIDGKSYTASYEEIGIKVNQEKLKKFLKAQHLHRKSYRTYRVNSVIEVNADKLEEFLKSIPELQVENMIKPQNAALTWDGTSFGTEKEKIGNLVDFEEAVEFAYQQINAGNENVYFQIITHAVPEIAEEDVEAVKKYYNVILSNCIKFKLVNGEEVTLDSETIKTWVKKEGKFGYVIDLDQGIANFVDELAVKVDEANKNNPELSNMKLNKSMEIQVIEAFLGNGGEVELDVAYEAKSDFDSKS